MNTQLEELLDRAAVVDLVSNYATGLDARDWILWRGVFLDEVLFDLESWSSRKPQLLETDRVVKSQARIFSELSVTQHFIGNHRVTLNGDNARCLAHMRAEHWINTNAEAQAEKESEDARTKRYTMFGYYDHKLIRTGTGWKIAEMQLNVTKTEGARWVMQEASRRAQAKKKADAK